MMFSSDWAAFPQGEVPYKRRVKTEHNQSFAIWRFLLSYFSILSPLLEFGGTTTSPPLFSAS
jgi:hypothetical protein